MRKTVCTQAAIVMMSLMSATLVFASKADKEPFTAHNLYGANVSLSVGQPKNQCESIARWYGESSPDFSETPNGTCPLGCVPASGVETGVFGDVTSVFGVNKTYWYCAPAPAYVDPVPDPPIVFPVVSSDLAPKQLYNRMLAGADEEICDSIYDYYSRLVSDFRTISNLPDGAGGTYPLTKYVCENTAYKHRMRKYAAVCFDGPMRYVNESFCDHGDYYNDTSDMSVYSGIREALEALNECLETPDDYNITGFCAVGGETTD